MIGFVQAGGGSTRFGTDKALAPLAGESLLSRTTRIVRQACDSVYVVAPEGKYGELAEPVVVDRYPGEGPLSGIVTALAAMDSWGVASPRWCLIVSCDMPFLTSEFLRFLRGCAQCSDAEVVVPEYAGKLEPLCACWRGDVLPEIQEAFDGGVRKVTGAMKRLRMEVLDEAAWKRFDTEDRLFWNMNTPADYEKARRVLEGERTV